MSDVVPEQAPAQPAPAAAPDTAAFTSAVEAFTAAVENLGVRLSDPQHEQRATVDPSRATVVESLVYTLDGRGNSFVQDAWNVHKGRYGSAETQDAFARIQKYEKQTQDLAHRAFMAGGRTTFANAGNTTDQAQLLPPGYRPDLYVGQIPQGRPLFEAVSSGPKRRKLRWSRLRATTSRSQVPSAAILCLASSFVASIHASVVSVSPSGMRGLSCKPARTQRMASAISYSKPLI